MDPLVYEHLFNLQFGTFGQHENLAILPLFSRKEDALRYLTMRTAIEKHLLTVTEVSSQGTVPELLVTNNADWPVLMLDGEELLGARQNRVLNTTILIAENSQTRIPVSCCEEGRWSYKSEAFLDSKQILNRESRIQKLRSVSNSLQEDKAYHSDQGEVWRNLRHLAQKAGINSATGAMNDIYAARHSELEEFLKSSAPEPGQKGLLVFINGEAAGLDVISREEAYQGLHAKLVRSYALDAVLEERKVQEPPSLEKARNFLQSALACQERQYPSVGYGRDYRFESQAVVGSALVYQGSVIHAAFFRVSPGAEAAQMSGYRKRRSYRRSDQPGQDQPPHL